MEVSFLCPPFQNMFSEPWGVFCRWSSLRETWSTEREGHCLFPFGWHWTYLKYLYNSDPRFHPYSYNLSLTQLYVQNCPWHSQVLSILLEDLFCHPASLHLPPELPHPFISPFFLITFPSLPSLPHSQLTPLSYLVPPPLGPPTSKPSPAMLTDSTYPHLFQVMPRSHFLSGAILDTFRVSRTEGCPGLGALGGTLQPIPSQPLVVFL